MINTDFFDEQSDIEATLAVSKKGKGGAETEGQLTVDVYQENGDIVVRSTIAGVSPDDLDISLTKDMVTIRGSRQREEKIKTGDYYHQELHWGAFSRSIILPEEIDSDRAKATMKNGILTLRLPKRVKTKKLKISS